MSLPKPSFVLYRRRGHVPSSSLPLFLGGQGVSRVKRHRYLAIIIVDRNTWRPAVANSMVLNSPENGRPNPGWSAVESATPLPWDGDLLIPVCCFP